MATSRYGVAKGSGRGLLCPFGGRFIWWGADGAGVVVVSVLEGEDAVPQSLFVLDLAAEPARTEFELPKMRSDIGGEAPKLIEEGDVVAVFLGARKERSWFLVLDDRGGATEPITVGTREDLLFLAGECAGLLFFRELAEAGEELGLD